MKPHLVASIRALVKAAMKVRLRVSPTWASRRFLRAVAVGLCGAAFYGGPVYAGPVLTSVSPKGCMSDGNYHRVTLSGSGLAGPSTNGYTFSRDVQLYISVNRAPYQEVTGNTRGAAQFYSWSPSALTIDLRSDAMCPAGGTLEFYVRVLNVNSNLVSLPIVPVPNVAPRILSIMPTEMRVTETKWLARIVATGLDYSSTAVSVGNVATGFLAYENPIDGVVDIYVPTALRTKPGRYQVVVTTSKGSSNPIEFDILGPPHIDSIMPSTISVVPSNSSPTIANQRFAAFPPLATASVPSGPGSRPGIVAMPKAALSSAISGHSIAISSSGIDSSVKLTFAGSPLTIEHLVLTYGAQKVTAQLPRWMADRCGHQAYPVQLTTSLGASNLVMLEVEGEPCAKASVRQSPITLPPSKIPLAKPLRPSPPVH